MEATIQVARIAIQKADIQVFFQSRIPLDLKQKKPPPEMSGGGLSKQFASTFGPWLGCEHVCLAIA